METIEMDLLHFMELCITVATRSASAAISLLVTLDVPYTAEVPFLTQLGHRAAAEAKTWSHGWVPCKVSVKSKIMGLLCNRRHLFTIMCGNGHLCSLLHIVHGQVYDFHPTFSNRMNVLQVYSCWPIALNCMDLFVFRACTCSCTQCIQSVHNYVYNVTKFLNKFLHHSMKTA